MKNLNKANKVITYTVSKVRDTKDMYISVQNGEVEIIAPLNYPNKKIQQIMSEKREWILSKIAEYNFNNLDNSNGIERNPVKILGINIKVKTIKKFLNLL